MKTQSAVQESQNRSTQEAPLRSALDAPNVPGVPNLFTLMARITVLHWRHGYAPTVVDFPATLDHSGLSVDPDDDYTGQDKVFLKREETATLTFISPDAVGWSGGAEIATWTVNRFTARGIQRAEVVNSGTPIVYGLYGNADLVNFTKSGSSMECDVKYYLNDAPIDESNPLVATSHIKREYSVEHSQGDFISELNALYGMFNLEGFIGDRSRFTSSYNPIVVYNSDGGMYDWGASGMQDAAFNPSLASTFDFPSTGATSLRQTTSFEWSVADSFVSGSFGITRSTMADTFIVNGALIGSILRICGPGVSAWQSTVDVAASGTPIVNGSSSRLIGGSFPDCAATSDPLLIPAEELFYFGPPASTAPLAHGIRVLGAAHIS